MKKNPLNDLEQFMQQQASSIVAPTSLSDKLTPSKPSTPSIPPSTSTEENLLELAKKNPQQFYDILIAVGERMDATRNTMLINTALYLKHGDNWKKAVKEYWQKISTNPSMF